MPFLTQAPVLDSFPDELVLLILSYLDIPELLAVSRTSYLLRNLALDHILHRQRLALASLRLAHSLPSRPSHASLSPPISTIILTPNHVLARTLSRQLVSIKLNRNISRRPSASDLVRTNILPPECCIKVAGTNEVIWGGGVAPRILSVKRQVEREKLKDGLRRWLEAKAAQVERQEEREEQRRVWTVRSLVRRFTVRKALEEDIVGKAGGSDRRWGKSRTERVKVYEPDRAKVLGLRRFWEGVARSQEISVMGG